MLPLSTQEYLVQRLLNPSNLAIAASIGIHGLILGLALPSFSSWSQDSQTSVSSPVNVVELTAAEQARLPDLYPAVPELSDVGNLPLADTSGLDAPPLASSLPSNFDSLPPPPSLPSLPPLSFNNRIPVAAAPRALPPSIPLRTLPAPPPFSPLRFSQPSGSRGSQLKFDPPRGPIDPDELINRKPNPDLPAGQAPAAANPGQAPPTVPPTLVAGLQRDDANTTNEEAMRNNVDWMAKNGIGQKPQSLEIAGSYPPAACLKQLEGTAIYGVSVTPQGKSEPHLIKSAGYPILNQQAVQDVKSAIPNQAGPYRVTVNYKYNSKICPAVPTTAPQTTDSPKPAPAASPATPTSPQPPKATPEVKAPPTAPPQPSVKPTPSEARRNLATPPKPQPSASPEVPEARRNPPATAESQPPAISGKAPTAAPSPALAASPEPAPGARKPDAPPGGIAPRKQ